RQIASIGSKSAALRKGTAFPHGWRRSRNTRRKLTVCFTTEGAFLKRFVPPDTDSSACPNKANAHKRSVTSHEGLRQKRDHSPVAAQTPLAVADCSPTTRAP